jgi:hypothetical protein
MNFPVILVLIHECVSGTMHVWVSLNTSIPLYDGSHPIEAFTIQESSDPVDSLVHGRFVDSTSKIGQSRFITSTIPNEGATDKDYFYALGISEGYLTAERIIQQLFNVVWSKPRQDAYIYDFLSAQYNYMRKNSERLWREDSFWFQVGLSLARLDGLIDGLKARQLVESSKNSDDNKWSLYPVTYMALYELNSVTELGEVVGSLAKDGQEVNTGRHTGGEDTPSAGLSNEEDDLILNEFEMAEQTKCSSLVKLVNPSSPLIDVIVSHNTWTSYSEMLRVYKTFIYRDVRHPSFANRKISMASYPGYLSSTDDWLTLSDTKILVTETTNECISKKRLRQFVVRDSVTTVVRSIVASVMSSSGSEWFDFFARENSGTYNNQWIVVDYKQLEFCRHNLEKPATDLLWIGEQAPGLVISKDMTDYLFDTGFWASYNRPYFAEIANVSGYSVAYKLKGEWYHHQKCPRARLFSAFQSQVVNVETMKDIMTMNRWAEMRNLSYLHSCPKNQIAGRYDIDAGLDVNSVDYRKCGPVMAYGALDCKITNSHMMLKDEILMVSGPLWNNTVPAFDWSAYPVSQGDAHWGHPDRWNFEFVKWRADSVKWKQDKETTVLPSHVLPILAH